MDSVGQLASEDSETVRNQGDITNMIAAELDKFSENFEKICGPYAKLAKTDCVACIEATKVFSRMRTIQALEEIDKGNTTDFSAINDSQTREAAELKHLAGKRAVKCAYRVGGDRAIRKADDERDKITIEDFVAPANLFEPSTADPTDPLF